VRDVVMLLASLVMLINFFVDLLYAWIDPRLKAGHAA
jgi:peptide/nickel transport system permease protein